MSSERARQLSAAGCSQPVEDDLQEPAVRAYWEQAWAWIHETTPTTAYLDFHWMCATLNLPPGAGTSTIESKTNFLRGCTGGTITGVATPVHVGRRTIVVQTDISRDDGKLVSRTIQTQAVLDN